MSSFGSPVGINLQNPDDHETSSDRFRLPAEEIAVAFVHVDGTAVAVRHVTESMVVDRDVRR